MSTVRPEHWGETCGVSYTEVFGEAFGSSVGVIDGEEESEGITAKVKKRPDLPSEKEVEEHYAADHTPYRSWCRACVMGQGANTPHRSGNQQELQPVSTVSMDYGFMTHEEAQTEDGYMPILVT